MNGHATLAGLQQDFRAWLVKPSEDLARRLGPPARLAVYQNNYRAQLVGCLEHAFPQVRAWLGEEAFLAAVVRHIDSRPPRDWTLDAYADGFPGALAAAFPDNPDLHELAWIEHALQAAFVARDADAIEAAAWAGVDWDHARLRLSPSLRLRPALTNADAIWSALAEDAPVPEGEMLADSGGLLVWRRGHQCVLRRVERLEYQALLLLQADGSFAALCDRLAAQLGEQEGVRHAGVFLGRWLGGQLVVGLDGGAPEAETSLVFIDGEQP